MSAVVETDIDIGLVADKWPTVALKDRDGNVVALLMLHASVPQLELFIDNAYRGNGKWLEMAETMKACAEKCKPYYAMARSEKVAYMCQLMGMKEVEGCRVFVME